MKTDTTQFKKLRKHLDALLNQLPDGANLNPAARIMNELTKLEVLNDRVGGWLAAALEDPKVCEAMKVDIRMWMEAIHD